MTPLLMVHQVQIKKSLKMHSIQIHTVLRKLISFYYLIGIWYRGKEPTIKDKVLRMFYSVYLTSFSISLIVAIATNEDIDQAIFSGECGIATAVLCVRLWIFIWKQEQIREFLNRISVFSIENYEDCKAFEGKVEKFMKFASVFLRIFFVYTFPFLIGPFVGNKRKLLMDFALPLDYKNNEIAFWIAYVYLTTEAFVAITTITTSVVIWYLMFLCSLRYEVLGSEISRMGRNNGQKKITQKEKQRNFLQGLTTSIESHFNLKRLIDEFTSLTSNLFLIQLATSGLCICGSVYCLTFDVGVNLVERVVHLLSIFYHLAELFSITYLGNEINLSSSRLSYSLFQSDWIEQPQSTKKSIITFAEYLKQPHVLIIGKLYPLTLETFSRILSLAYSLFNILKGTKQ